MITYYRANELLICWVLVRLPSNTKDCKSSDQILRLDGYFFISDTLTNALLMVGLPLLRDASEPLQVQLREENAKTLQQCVAVVSW